MIAFCIIIIAYCIGHLDMKSNSEVHIDRQLAEWAHNPSAIRAVAQTLRFTL